MAEGKRKVQQFIINLFNRYFGFEKDIDITNEVKVLHRRNEVLKNITFLSNILYTIILLVLATITKKPSDYLFTALFFPLTYFINIVIKQLITKDRHDYTKQTVAMYIMALYIFATAILFYARFYSSRLEIAAYVMIYYSIVVVSLYQSKRLTLWSSIGMLIIMTIIHFMWTYQVVDEFRGLNLGEFFKAFLRHEAFGDFVLRFFVYVFFNIVIYSIVSMGQYLQDERRKETLIRSEVQQDYTDTVSDLFQIILAMKSDFLDYQNSFLVAEMSMMLAELSGFDTETKNFLNYYVNIHLKVKEIELLVNPEIIYKMSFDELKEKTDLGNQIAKRIQITRKSDNIMRSVIDNVLDRNFVEDANKIQNDPVGQIILMSELYIGMRSTKSFKRPTTHDSTMNLFKKEFKVFFDDKLLERLVTFQDDFKNLYLNA